MSGDETPAFTTEQQEMLKSMMSDAVKEALQAEKDRAPVGNNQDPPTDPKLTETQGGSGPW